MMLRDSEGQDSVSVSSRLRAADTPSELGLQLFPPRRSPPPVRARPKQLADKLARFGDVALAGVLLALTLPLMVVIALAIRCRGSGPILVSQQRIGCDGRVVDALRFRTTHASAAGTQWLRRVHRTGLGSLLWRTHLDAIPMLINVLRGEMTIVGLNGCARLLR